MAAITTHIGQQDPEDVRADAEACEIERKSGLSGPRACVPPVSASHSGLTKMVWLRRTLEDLLVGRRVSVVDGQSLGVHLNKHGKPNGNGPRLFFVLDPPYLREEIQWMVAAPVSYGYIGMIGEAGKMACPTFDLPAGALSTGGSCPGAQAGQSTVPLQIRKKSEVAITAPVQIRTAICEQCYANGGQYQSPHIQLGEIVRYWWTRDLLKTNTGREDFVRTVVRAIQGETFHKERQLDPRTGTPVLPFRIHSSGDFFSHEYAEAWIEIANRTPEVTYWAPTRTWAYPGWMAVWPRLMQQLKHNNMIVRPSAYHTDDPAPSPDALPWPSQGYPFNSQGTTSIYKFNDQGEGRDPRYDFGCRAYAVVDAAKSCNKATAPDGKTGCRACWVRPDLRIQYSAH